MAIRYLNHMHGGKGIGTAHVVELNNNLFEGRPAAPLL